MLALCLLGPIWGYGWVVTKVGLEYAQPFTYVALRVAFTAAGLFLLLVVLRRSLRPPPLLWIVPIALLQTTAFVGLTTWALQSGAAGKVAVLCYTMPFWLLLLAWGFLGERLHDVQWLAVAVALAGLVLVVSPWHIQGAFSSVLTLLGGFSWAASGLLVKLLERHHDVDLLSLTTWQMIIGAAPLVAIALLTHQPAPQWTAAFAASLAYNVMLANAVAWLLWLYALRVLPDRRRRSGHAGRARGGRARRLAAARRAARRRRGRGHGADHRRAGGGERARLPGVARDPGRGRCPRAGGRRARPAADRLSLVPPTEVARGVRRGRR